MKQEYHKKTFKLVMLILVILCIFLTSTVFNLKYKENNTIYKNYYNGLRNFYFIMNDYNKDINENNNINDKTLIIKNTIIKLDYLDQSLGFENLNKEFSSPISSLVNNLLKFNIEKIEEDPSQLKDIISVLDNVYIIAKQIHDIPLEKFYKEKKFEFLNLELSDETLKYLYQLK